MKCGYCGKEVKDDAQFCSNCGHSTEVPSDDSSQPQKAEKGAYTLSIIALLIVIALTAYGGFVIIRRDLHTEKSVSSSDKGQSVFNYDSNFTDPALYGKWKCTDRAAADYSDGNFGVEVKILLTLTGDGKFTLDYTMTDTGVPAKALSASGNYSTGDGMITFAPDDNPEIAEYLKRHGQRPSFQYSTDEGRFTLKYENGKAVLFTQVKEQQ